MGRPKKTATRSRLPALSEELSALLFDDPFPETGNPLALLMYEPAREWPKWRDSVMPIWLEERPGTRPSSWWVCDAPRLKDASQYDGCYFQKDMIEPRLLLEGQGGPAWEELSIVPGYSYGIPKYWIGGRPESLKFESQYDYLHRHGLLAEGEGRSPEPVVIPERWDASQPR